MVAVRYDYHSLKATAAVVAAQIFDPTFGSQNCYMYRYMASYEFFAAS